MPKSTRVKKKAKVNPRLLSKLERLPASQQAVVLDFVKVLSGRNRSATNGSRIYAYTSALLKEKAVKKLSLKEIEAIVHEVRDDTNGSRRI